MYAHVPFISNPTQSCNQVPGFRYAIPSLTFGRTECRRYSNFSLMEINLASTCIRNVFSNLNRVIFNFGHFVMLETGFFSVSNFLSTTRSSPASFPFPQLALVLLLSFTQVAETVLIFRPWLQIFSPLSSFLSSIT